MSAPLPPNESRGPSLVVSQWITVSIATLFVVLRIYTRAFLRHIAGADDWTVVVALGFALAQSILTVFWVDNGFGRNIEYLQPDQIRNIILMTTIVETLHTIGTFLVRVSVCLFMLRLVPPTHREFYRYTYILMAFFTIISTTTCLLILLGCIPIRGTWDKSIKARCIDPSTLSIIAKTQGITALMDLLCVGLPIYFFRNLQAKLVRKISLFALLGLGLFTAACAILWSVNISFATEDFTWNGAIVAFWGCYEQTIGIIVASTPAAYQFYTIVLERFFPNIGTSAPHVRALKFRTSSGYTNTGDASQPGRTRFGSRGSQSMRMMSTADGGDGGAILPGPPSPTSPTKKEPRLDYDSPRLDISPKLEQTATGDEGFSYLER